MTAIMRPPKLKSRNLSPLSTICKKNHLFFASLYLLVYKCINGDNYHESPNIKDS